MLIKAKLAVKMVSGKIELPEFQRQVALFRNNDCIGQRFRTVGKKFLHLRGGAEIKLIRLEPHPILVLDRLSRLNAQENLMSLGIRPV